MSFLEKSDSSSQAAKANSMPTRVHSSWPLARRPSPLLLCQLDGRLTKRPFQLAVARRLTAGERPPLSRTSSAPKRSRAWPPAEVDERRLSFHSFVGPRETRRKGSDKFNLSLLLC